MTNAERQRRYRERHLKDVDAQGERIALVVTVPAKAALTRLASWHGTTQRQALERALIESQARIINTLTGEQQNAFHDGKLTASALPSNGHPEPLQGNDTPAHDAKIKRLRSTVSGLLQTEEALHKEIRELRAHLKNRDAQIEHQKTMRAVVERERDMAKAEVSRLKSAAPVTAPDADKVASPLPSNETAKRTEPLPSNKAERDQAIREAKAAHPEKSNYQLAREFDTSEPTVRRALKG
ncbi:transcriptional regulator [Thiorhodovibrio frisius]|nr:transcriptional regulator [Thiorhodovibrio frisius]